MFKFIRKSLDNFWSLSDGLGKFTKKLSVLALINIGTQIVSVIGFVYMSRIYSVSAIGDYVTYLALAAILSLLSTGNYEQALYIENRPRLIKKLIILPLTFSITFSLLSGAVLLFIGVDNAIYISLAIFSAGVLKTSVSLNIANNRLVFNSLFTFAISPVMPLLIILNGKYFSTESDIMIMLNAVTALVTSVLFFFISTKFKWNPRKFFSGFHWLQLFWLSKRYKKFLGFGMVGEFIGSSAMRIPILIANEYFSNQFAAYYGVVLRIAITPLALILGNISQIFMHRVSYNRKNNLPSLKLYLKFFTGLLLLAIVGCIVVLLYGHDIIIFFLTEKYEIVFTLLVYLLPYIFVLAVISPLTSVLNVFEKQEYAFYNKIALFLCTSASFSYGAYIHDFYLAVYYYSIGMTVIYSVIFLEIFIILYKDNVQHKKICK